MKKMARFGYNTKRKEKKRKETPNQTGTDTHRLASWREIYTRTYIYRYPLPLGQSPKFSNNRFCGVTEVFSNFLLKDSKNCRFFSSRLAHATRRSLGGVRNNSEPAVL
jgi:hypothetical protein